jgi:SOS-response transcriptional repressor LexA
MRENKRRAFWQELGERLESIIEEKGWTKKYFAELMNIQETAVNKYLSGEFDPTNFIEKLVENGVSRDWFLTGKKLNDRINIKKTNKGYFYPLLAKVYAGEPNLLFQQNNIVNEPIYFDYGISPIENRCFALHVEGDSMTNGGRRSLEEGDYVLIDMNATILPGDIVVAVLHNGREIIKQFNPVNDELIRLVSFNQKYPDIILNKEEIVAIYRVMKKTKVITF